jgi:hypothetical protein
MVISNFKLMDKERLPTTLVLPIVGLDIETISSSNSAVLWFGA